MTGRFASGPYSGRTVRGQRCRVCVTVQPPKKLLTEPFRYSVCTASHPAAAVRANLFVSNLALFPTGGGGTEQLLSREIGLILMGLVVASKEDEPFKEEKKAAAKKQLSQPSSC